MFLFVEERKDRADNLSKEIEALKCPDGLKTEVKCGEFAPTLTAILDELTKSDLRLAPTFAMIDPFGFAGIPFVLMNRLLDNPSCEPFVRFMVDSINRWLNHPSDEIRDHIRDAFGSDEPFALLEKATDRQSRSARRLHLFRCDESSAASFLPAFLSRDPEGKSSRSIRERGELTH